MDNDNLIVKAITTFCIAAIISASGCSINKQNKLAEMVKNGVDPQKAACAVYAGESSAGEMICNLLAAKE